MYENFVYKYIDHCVVKMNQKASIKTTLTSAALFINL